MSKIAIALTLALPLLLAGGAAANGRPALFFAPAPQYGCGGTQFLPAAPVYAPCGGAQAGLGYGVGFAPRFYSPAFAFRGRAGFAAGGGLINFQQINVRAGLFGRRNTTINLFR